jgi:hypothetical protein
MTNDGLVKERIDMACSLFAVELFIRCLECRGRRPADPWT